MAKGDRNLGWPGFFRVFTVLCAMMLLLAQSGQQSVAAGSGNWQVLSVYEGLTSWAIPALFMLWGMFALEEGKPHFSAAMVGLALPAFCLLVFWGALYAIVSTLLGGGSLSWGGVWSALVSAAKGNTYFHLWVLYPLIGLYLVHPVLHRFTASALGKPVIAGPGEATVIGNLLVQAMALGEIGSLSELRQVVRASFDTREYLPEKGLDWDGAYARLMGLVKG